MWESTSPLQGTGWPEFRATGQPGTERAEMIPGSSYEWVSGPVPNPACHLTGWVGGGRERSFKIYVR